MWIIRSYAEPELTWNNENGWGEGDDWATVFTDSKSSTFLPPVGMEIGYWEQIVN